MMTGRARGTRVTFLTDELLKPKVDKAAAAVGLNNTHIIAHY